MAQIENDARKSAVEHALVVLHANRALTLEPRDIALVILIRSEIDADEETGFTLPFSTIRSLHARLDDLDGGEPQTGERRLSESLARLKAAGCLVLADIFRVHDSEDADYQLTAFGDALYNRHVTQSEFTGEPFTAILRVFIALLETIVGHARRAKSQEDWDYDVIQPMRHALRSMLESVDRHQKELDRQHSELREFIPVLMREHNESSISLCKEKLAHVFRTINDLQTVVLSTVSSAHNLINEIRHAAKIAQPRRVDSICEETTRRIRGLERWTTARSIDWMAHHNVVHKRLRGNILIDKNRRVTEAMRQAILVPPDWTISTTCALPFIRMRKALNNFYSKEPPRLPREILERRRDVELINTDDLPELLLRYLSEDLERGEALLSRLMARAYEDRGVQLELGRHFSWLLGQMLSAGLLDDTNRSLTSATPRIDVEELRVTK